MTTRSDPLRLLCAALLTLFAALLLGVMTGLAGRQIYVIGLWELCAAWMLSFVAVAVAHFFGVRRPVWLTTIGCIAALFWLVGFHFADAWAFRQEQIRLIAQRGLLLSDEAVLRDTGDPSQLVDLSLLGETGAMGLRGAARLLLERGLTVHRALGVSHILPVPSWLHAAVYGAQVTVVAVILSRALASLADQPVCSRCQTWLRREKLGFVAPHVADHAHDAWLLGDRIQPAANTQAGGAEDLLLTRDRCPRGCTQTPGFSVLRRRAVGLSARKPGIFASIAPVESAAADGGATVEDRRRG